MTEKDVVRLAEVVIIKKILREESSARACGCKSCERDANWYNDMLEGLIGFEKKTENLKSKIEKYWRPEILNYRPVDKIKPYQEMHSCAPASLKIVYSCFGLELSEDEIIDTMAYAKKSTILFEKEDVGWWEILRTHPEGYWFTVFFQENSQYQDLFDCLGLGLPIIVSWRSTADPDDNSHFGVVYRLDSFYTHLVDPLKGEFSEVSKEDFLERWETDDEGFTRPMMVIFPVYQADVYQNNPL